MDEKFDQAILSNDQTHSFNSLGLFQTIKESSQQNSYQPYHIYQLIPKSISIRVKINWIICDFLEDDEGYLRTFEREGSCVCYLSRLCNCYGCILGDCKFKVYCIRDEIERLGLK